MTKVKSTVRANIVVNPIPIFPFMFDFVVINIELLFLFFICFHSILSYDPKRYFRLDHSLGTLTIAVNCPSPAGALNV